MKNLNRVDQEAENEENLLKPRNLLPRCKDNGYQRDSPRFFGKVYFSFWIKFNLTLAFPIREWSKTELPEQKNDLIQLRLMLGKSLRET